MNIRVAILIGAVLITISGWSAEAPSLDSLAWLEGHWVALSWHEDSGWKLTDPASGNEEIWTSPKGGVMVGLGRTIRADGSAFVEFLRIEERPEGIVLVARPMGAGSTEFPLVAVDGQRVVFENPKHDMPQNITYWRVGNRLHAEVTGKQGSDLLLTDQFQWQLAE